MRLWRVAMLVAVAITLSHTSFAAIWMSQVDAVCTGADGVPLVGAVVRFRDPSTGRHFQITTDNEGKFFYIAVEPGRYNVQLSRGGRALADFYHVQIPWSSRPLAVNFDLAKNSVTVKRRVLAVESYSGDVAPDPTIPENAGGADLQKVQAINRELLAAKSKGDQGDWRGAIEILNSATDIDPQRDLPWAHLANAECHAAAQADNDREKLLRDCAHHYERAIAINPLSAYHNNLGQAYAKLQRWRDAVREFREAANQGSSRTALYEMNAGKTLLQEWEARASTSLKPAVSAFEEVIKLEPGNAEAYYLKGLCQLREAAQGGDRAEYREVESALRRYLELQPAGTYAEEARGMLTALAAMKE